MLRYLSRRSVSLVGSGGQATACYRASFPYLSRLRTNCLVPPIGHLVRYENDKLRKRDFSALTDSNSPESVDTVTDDSHIHLVLPLETSSLRSSENISKETSDGHGFPSENILTPSISTTNMEDNFGDDSLDVDVVMKGLSVENDLHEEFLHADEKVDDGLESPLPIPSAQPTPLKLDPNSSGNDLVSLLKGLQIQDPQVAMNAFNRLMSTNERNRHFGLPPIDIPAGVVKGLFHLIQPTRTFDIFRVVEYYVTIPTTLEYLKAGGNISAYSMYYNVVCDSIAYLDPRHHYKRECCLLVDAILDRVSRMDKSGQEQCIPRLLSALVQQHSAQVGAEFTGKVYKYMTDNNFSVNPGFWVRLLTFSRYNRQDEIPFCDVLTRVVELGLRPNPVVVLNVLENFFPFSNSQAVSKSLKAILILQRHVASEIKAVKNASAKATAGVRHKQIADACARQYFVDMTILETIGASAASQGESEICLMIWDMIDILGYMPTEGIYENTIVAFAMNPFTYREAFIVLNEMESRGFIPSRALIRSFSIRVRDSIGNLDFAQEQILLLRREGNVAITTSMMNVLLSSAAERGDIDRILSILHDFDRYGTAFNADTISFGFESLGKNLSRRRRYNPTFLDSSNAATRDHIGACMVVANALLNQMDDYQIETTDHIIRNYIEFLCRAGYLDTAATIILEASQKKGLVSSKSIYRVAIANAKAFKFDVARQLAHCNVNSEPLQFLLDAITREENLYEKAVKHENGRQFSDTEKFKVVSNGGGNILSDDEDENSHFDESQPQKSIHKHKSPSSLSTFWKRTT